MARRYKWDDPQDWRESFTKPLLYVKNASNVAAATRVLRPVTGLPVFEIVAAIREGHSLPLPHHDPMTLINSLHEVGAECEIDYEGETFDLRTPERKEEARRRFEEQVMAIEELIAKGEWLKALLSLPLTAHREETEPRGGDWSSITTHRDGEKLAQHLAALGNHLCTVQQCLHIGMPLGIRAQGSYGVTGVTSFDTCFFRTGEAEWQEDYQFYSD